MGGKKRKILVKPNASMVRPPPTLPTRYDFEPRSQTVPPAPSKAARQPSVADYPPPFKMFNTSGNPESRASPQSQASPVLNSQPSPVVNSQTSPAVQSQVSPVVQSQVSPVANFQASPVVLSNGSRRQASRFEAVRMPSPRRAQSTHSSQAQNSSNQEEPENQSDGEGPVEPTLSEDNLQALNSLLLAPRPRIITILDPDLAVTGSTWFGFDNSKLTRQITKVFTKKFDGPYYNWSSVPRDRQERYFIEFAKKHRWDPSITGLVQEEFESIIQLRLKDMVSNARRDDVQPAWIPDDIWRVMKLHWSTEEQICKSATTSAARMSQRKGLGPHKHTSGQKSYNQLGQEMAIELGRPVSWGEVFIMAHTNKKGEFVDLKAKQVADAYRKKQKDKLVELDIEPTEISDGRHPSLPVEEDNELFLQSTFTNDRGEVFGIGSLKQQLKTKQVRPQSPAITELQQQLEDAKQQIRYQAAQIAEFSLMQKYFLHTDERFQAFAAQHTSSTAQPTAPIPPA